MTTKKVLIVYSGARVWGGIETYLESLFKYYDKKKLKLVLVSLGEWELTKKLLISNNKCLILDKSRLRLKTVSEIIELAGKEKADLIVSQGVVANAYARLAARKCSLPHLATVHSDINYDYPDQAKRILYKISDKQLRNVTKRYITVSKYLKVELMQSGIPADKISVIYNGVDEEAIKLKVNPDVSDGKPGSRSKHRGSKKLENNKITTVGSVGRFHYTKGYHNLIEAFAHLKDLPVNLVLYGDGEEKKQLEELTIQLGVSDKISFPGYTQDITEALEKIDIYIQPSLMEGFGLTVVEAMLAGKPVVVTPVGSLPELLTDGKTGLIAGDTKPESIAVAIKALLENKELAQKIALAGKIEAQKRFAIDRWIRDTEKVYMETAK